MDVHVHVFINIFIDHDSILVCMLLPAFIKLVDDIFVIVHII